MFLPEKFNFILCWFGFFVLKQHCPRLKLIKTKTDRKTDTHSVSLRVSLFTSLYKSVTNDLAVLRVLVAQWIERLPGVRKVVGSNTVICSDFYFSEYCWFEKERRQKLEFIPTNHCPNIFTDYCASP